MSGISGIASVGRGSVVEVVHARRMMEIAWEEKLRLQMLQWEG